jgi:signal transduction histidine kinase
MSISYDYVDPEKATPPRAWVGALLLTALIGPLALRRVYPVAVLAITTVAFVLVRTLDVPEGTLSSVAVFVAIYTVGAWGSSARARLWARSLAIGASMVMLAVNLAGKVEALNTDVGLELFFTIAINVAFFTVAWVMGDLARRQHENEAELALRADELAAEREIRTRQAVMDERVRIARELHDVVAHHVSVMGVQAGAARRIMSTHPEQATAALEAIEESGRQAVGELQKLVGFLRSTDEADTTGPQPTMDDLESLCDQLRGAGLPVERRTIGRPRPVPDSVALSAYRIIQEALTNTLKHAGSVPTHVVLTYGSGSLDVEVVNRRGQQPARPGGGRGLLGMRERAAMLGGTFSSGVTTDGGYRIAASLPTGTAYDGSAVTA